MANLNIKRTEMPVQEPDIRNKNFNEVALGYTEEMALAEASRCLQCKNKPCVSGCFVNVDIPEFINKITQKDYIGAYKVISKSSTLPAICGRVCPQENQCEGKCIRGIKGEPVAIGRLERFVADYYMNNSKSVNITKPKTNGKKVAIIGAGPSGLTCAGDLAKLGYEVTIFEAFHTPGGVLVYGIPEFRLPKKIVEKEINNLKQLGVKIITDMVIGKVLSIDEIINMGFNAVFIGSGAGLPMFLGIEGEASVGVYSANEFLTRINLMKAYLDNYDTPIYKANSVAVVGGGNVAMDAARCAKRLGAENVYIVYRRSIDEMPARKEEVIHAMEEGIEFKLLSNPERIIADSNGFVKGIECAKMELGQPDASGRRRPVKIDGENFVLNVDSVIIAIGTTPNSLINSTTENLEINSKGCLIVDENMSTTKSGVYAGGDAVTGSATVIMAMGAGKKAAASIHNYLSKQ